MEKNEVVQEDPSIVKGGPLDPTTQTGALAAPQPKEEKPLYKGLTGEIKTPEELARYASTLEAMVVARKEASEPKNEGISSFSAPQATIPPQPKPETFEDLIYTDPVRAKQVLEQEIEVKWQQRETQKAREQNFWNNFYSKNPDLKEVDRVVKSVFDRDFNAIRQFRSDSDIMAHLEKEARDIVDLVKDKAGIKSETKLESKPAVTVTGRGEPAAALSAKPTAPKTFSEQIARLKRRQA